MADSNVEESVEDLPCMDTSLSEDNATAAFFLEINDCAAIQHDCWMMNKTAFRALCPVTCGCTENAPSAGGIFQTQSWGCPRACSVFRYQLLWKTSCEDDLESISNSSWKEYVSSLREHVTSLAGHEDRVRTYIFNLPVSVNLNPDQGQTAFEYFMGNGFWDDLSSFQLLMGGGVPHARNLTGCNFMASNELMLLLNVNLCASDGTYTSLRGVCPVACGCKLDTDTTGGCPFDCAF